MKRNYLVLTLVVILVGIFTCLNVYADDDGPSKLPGKVMSAIKSLFPKGEIEEVEIEVEGIDCYEVEVENGDIEYTVTVAPCGTIIEKEQEIDIKDLPKKIRKKIKKTLADAEIEEATKEYEYYEITLKKLDKPKISYEVEVEIDGREMEIEFAANGIIIEKEVIDDDDHDDDDDDDDDDE